MGLSINTNTGTRHTHQHTPLHAEVSTQPSSRFFLPDVYTVRLLHVEKTAGVAVVSFDEVEIYGCT